MKEYRITSNGLVWHIEYLKHYKSFWRRPRQKWLTMQRSIGCEGYQIDANFYSLKAAREALCMIKTEEAAEERGFIPVETKTKCP